MKKNYASLLNQITELYIKALAMMYYWDKRCDDVKDGENAVYCDIRNEYAHEASAYFNILNEEVSQEDIEDMHRTAKQTANLQYIDTATGAQTIKTMPNWMQEDEDDAFDRANAYPISKEWE